MPDLSPENQAALNDIEKQLAEFLRPNSHVQYAAYECDSNGTPVNNLLDIAVEGMVVFVAQSDEFFGGKESVSYQSSPIENPTWLELCDILDEQIGYTKDSHHVFLEGVVDAGRTIKIAGETVKVFELDLGS